MATSSIDMSMRWPRPLRSALEQRGRQRKGAGGAGRIVDRRRPEHHRIAIPGPGHRHDADVAWITWS